MHALMRACVRTYTHTSTCSHFLPEDPLGLNIHLLLLRGFTSPLSEGYLNALFQTNF